jgi:hypothetical protein
MSIRSQRVMVRQQFKQYIHHTHYMSILDKTTHSEKVLVQFTFDPKKREVSG